MNASVLNDDLFSFSMLTNRTSNILIKLEGDYELNESDNLILEDSCNFLEKIIKGSILINNEKERNGLHASSEGLNSYGYALTVLDRLNLLSEEEEIIDIILGLKNNLTLLMNKNTLNKNKIDTTKLFFKILSKLITEDFQKSMINN